MTTCGYFILLPISQPKITKSGTGKKKTKKTKKKPHNKKL
jgi:hypothetical protein